MFRSEDIKSFVKIPLKPPQIILFHSQANLPFESWLINPVIDPKKKKKKVSHQAGEIIQVRSNPVLKDNYDLLQLGSSRRRFGHLCVSSDNMVLGQSNMPFFFFFTTDIFTSHSRKSTRGTNNINKGCVPVPGSLFIP